MNKNLVITSFIGAFTIILGAFGAHALKDMLSIEELKSFETAVKYQMYHLIVLLFVNTNSIFSLKVKNTLSYLFLLGILFFSGSIYAITLGVDARSIWFITPIGGLLLASGWLKMGMEFFKNKST